MRRRTAFGAVSAQATRRSARVEPSVWPAVQFLLCGGRLPQADDAAIAALSRAQGLPRHGGDVDLSDAARDNAGTPDASVDRAGDRSADPGALARLVACDLYRGTLRAGRQGHLH